AGLAVLLAAGGGAAFFLLGQRSQPSPAAVAGADSGQEQISALTEALAANQVQLAKKRLEDKNYQGAEAQAERALKLDPRSAEAQKVLEDARGVIKSMQAAETETRARLQAKDDPGAARALWNLLSADPNHPASAELTAALDKSFRPQAEEARRLMGESRAAAEAAKAGRLDPFSEALGLVKDADSLL